jgi:cell division protein FtsW (lipid II flippase)
MVEIIAKSTHSEQRTRDFFKFHLFRVNPTRYIYLGVAMIVFIVTVVFALLKDYGKSLFLLFVALMILVIRIVSTNMVVSRALKNVIFPARNYTLIFNENEVAYATNNTKNVYKWNQFLKIYEVNNYIFFYLSKNQALILPKYGLNDEERLALKEIIKTKKVKFITKKFK